MRGGKITTHLSRKVSKAIITIPESMRGLKSRISAEIAGIKKKGGNKWVTVIQSAAKELGN